MRSFVFSHLLFALLVSLLVSLPCAFANEQHDVTVLSDREETSADIVVRVLNFREQLVARLEDAHRMGELLDISVQDIRNLPMAQLMAIENAENLIEYGESVGNDSFSAYIESDNEYINHKNVNF